MKQFRKLTWAVIASMSLFSACSNVDEEEEEGPKDPTVEIGTEANPYSVAKLLELPYGGSKDTIARGVWVEGYIVGNIEQFPMESDPDKTENKPVFEAPFTSDVNVLIADMGDSKDASNCANVQIKGYNTKVGLASVSSNLGKKIKMKGDLRLYNNFKGVLNLQACYLDGTSLDGGAVTPGVIEVCGDVTPLSTYSYDFEDMVDFEDFNTTGWQNVLISGERVWKETVYTDKNTGNVQKYIQASAHNAAAGSHEMWAISPALDLSKATSKQVSFSLAKAYLKESTLFEIYALQCVDGKTVQTKLDVTLPTTAPDHTFIVTTADLSAFNGTVFIGFRYKGEGGSSNSTTWRIDDFVFGEEVPQETTVSVSYGTATVETNAALNCEIKATVINGEGATVITAEGVPAWATFADNGDGTASIKGTAPAAAEQSTVTIKATNNNVEASKTFTLKVYAPAQPGDALIANGSFETWTDTKADFWAFKAVSGVEYSKETTIVKEGSAAVKVISGATSGTASISADRIALEAGEYTYSFDYYLDANVTVNNTFRSWAMVYDNMETTTQVPDKDHVLTPLKKALQPATYVPTDKKGEWVNYSTTFTVPEKAFIIFDVRIYKGTTGYVDNVVLTKK